MMLGDAEVRRILPLDEMDLPDEDQESPHRSIDAEFPEDGTVSCLHRCQSEAAKKLCIFDFSRKLKNNSEYDIGGTYTGNEPDLWFYYSISICPGYNLLVNLFVCHRKVGNFSIRINNSNDFCNAITPSGELSARSALPNSLIWYTFKSVKPNEIYHIKTYCFNEKNKTGLERNNCFIPITIVMNSGHSLNNDFLMSIKLKHDLSGLLAKKEKTDFALISASGKKFPAHKIILVAHSPILRSLIKDSDNDYLFIDILDSDMDLLLQFLYTGTLKDITKQDCMNMLNIADKFQLENLFLLTQHAIGEQINAENAVDIALICQKYKLEKLQSKVFCFIKNNPKVVQSDSWKNLNDIELTKQLIEHIYVEKD